MPRVIRCGLLSIITPVAGYFSFVLLATFQMGKGKIYYAFLEKAGLPTKLSGLFITLLWLGVFVYCCFVLVQIAIGISGDKARLIPADTKNLLFYLIMVIPVVLSIIAILVAFVMLVVYIVQTQTPPDSGTWYYVVG